MKAEPAIEAPAPASRAAPVPGAEPAGYLVDPGEDDSWGSWSAPKGGGARYAGAAAKAWKKAVRGSRGGEWRRWTEGDAAADDAYGRPFSAARS